MKEKKKYLNLKGKLLQEGLLENRCYRCDLGPMYNNKPLTLQLDHINGDHSDNSIENLRILCPNCHSQTDNFCGKNKKSHIKNKKIIEEKKLKAKIKKEQPPKQRPNCEKCGKVIYFNKKLCRSCSRLDTKTKIVWPSMDELSELLKKHNYVQLAKILGVSDNAIRKRFRNRGKEIPTSVYDNKPKNNGGNQ